MPDMSTALSLADLNTTVNHEVRVLDIRLAEALGLAQPRDIRKLIARHLSSLERLGRVCATVAQTSAAGGRPAKSYWLTKKQALFICTKAEAANATETTIQMVEVFDAWQRGVLETTSIDYGQTRYRVRIDGREVLVDPSDTRAAHSDEVLVCGYDGEIAIVQGPLEPSVMAKWLGARSVSGSWQEQSRASGMTKQRSIYIVLGRVVSEAANADPEKPVRVRSHRRGLPRLIDKAGLPELGAFRAVA